MLDFVITISKNNKINMAWREQAQTIKGIYKRNKHKFKQLEKDGYVIKVEQIERSVLWVAI